MRKIMTTLHRCWWIFILVGIYILWNSLDLLLRDVYWRLYTHQEIIKDCIIRGVLFLFFVVVGVVLGLCKKRYIAKFEKSEFITSLYFEGFASYDHTEIILYKKGIGDMYRIHYFKTVYNGQGTFDLEKGYFNNHSIEDFCDFIQKKCFLNDDSYPDFREIIKQNHTILKLFKC